MDQNLWAAVDFESSPVDFDVRPGWILLAEQKKAGTFQTASQRWLPVWSTPSCPAPGCIQALVTGQKTIWLKHASQNAHLNPSNSGQSWKHGQCSRADIIGFKWIQNFKTKELQNPENFLIIFFCHFLCWFSVVVVDFLLQKSNPFLFFKKWENTHKRKEKDKEYL